MINESLIKTELSGLVGFKNSTISGYSVVDADNQVSNSGLYFQEGHKLVTIKNIKDTLQDESITDGDFNTYLQEEQESCIIDVCNKVINGKSVFVESGTLFPYEQSFNNTIDPSTGFVGIQIKPSLNERILLKITAIIASFNEEITLPVKLFSSETGTELYSQDIITKALTGVKQAVNWTISLNTNTTTGGKYYLGYYTSDLGTALPYEREWESASSYIPPRSYYMEFQRNDLNGTRIDVESDDAINDPYGINIQYSVYTDWTQKIIENKHLFSRAIQLQMAERVIEQIFTSTRSNHDQRKTQELRTMSNYVLEGAEGRPGIRRRLADEIEDIRQTFWPEQSITTWTLK